MIVHIFQPLIHAWKPQYNVDSLLTLAVQPTDVEVIRDNNSIRTTQPSLAARLLNFYVRRNLYYGAKGMKYCQ